MALATRLSILWVGSILVAGCGPDYQFDEAEAVYSDFSGQRAFEQVEKLVAFGPRPSGSEALARSREFIVGELEALGWGVKAAPAALPTPEGEVEFVNIRARFSPSQDPAIWDRPVEGILCSHYDSKRFSGFEFVGANDSGSSTGALLEIARVVAANPDLATKLELVFFDGEEAFGTNITDSDGLYGSRTYAMETSLLPASKRPRWGLLLDMIGDRDLNIRAGVQVEEKSLRSQLDAGKDGESEPGFDPEQVASERRNIGRLLLRAAEDLGLRSKFGISPNYITDDHVPLNQDAGIPTIDIIDFDFDYWHTPGDTLDKISAESLETVGKVTLLLVEKYLLGRVDT